MGGDDAPHTSNNSSKHYCIFAGNGLSSAKERNSLTLKVVSTCHASHNPQIRPYPVGRLEREWQRLREVR